MAITMTREALAQIEEGLTGDRVACSVFAGTQARVSMEVLLPPGVSPGRYEALKAEVAAAVERVAQEAMS